MHHCSSSVVIYMLLPFYLQALLYSCDDLLLDIIECMVDYHTSPASSIIVEDRGAAAFFLFEHVSEENGDERSHYPSF
jgi:hypothetical protein